MASGISSLDSKVWFDAINNKPIMLNPYETNHTKSVLDNPEFYRLPKDFFAEYKSKYDYDGKVLFNAMKQRFVRIMLDYRDPQYGCNVEGVSLIDIHKAAIWLDAFVLGLKKVIIVVRKSEADKDGDAYILDDEKKIEFFLKFGKILRDRF